MLRSALALALALLLPLAPTSFARQVDPDAERAELEADFERTMSGAKLVGHFTMSDAPQGELSEESYTIAKVSKVEGETWRFETLVEYGGRSVTVPMNLKVKWAGDTPVITLTDLSIPMLGTYTARVLIYRGQYAGTWSGGDHGGHLFGRIERADLPAGSEGADRDTDGEEAGERMDGEPAEGDGGAGARQVSYSTPLPGAPADDLFWPSFRGPQACGWVDDGEATAVEWDVEAGEGIAWRTPLPGLAHSSPVIAGERIYLTSAMRLDGESELKVGLYGSIEPVPDEGEHAFLVLALDRASGEVLWKASAWEGTPKYPRHPKGSFAASTPATDGTHVVAFFGTEGLYCYDAQGEQLWSKSFGDLHSAFYMVPSAHWGFSASPVIHDGKVLVQCDIIGESFLTALDVETGEELWRVKRDDVPTWSTPTVDVREGRSQVIVNGMKQVGGYDLETGAELWSLAGGGDIPVPTPVIAGDLVYITNAHGQMAPIYAIKTGATGTVALKGEGEEHMAWGYRSRGNYMQTPLAYAGYLYCCSDGGVLACYDAASGEELYRERLGSGGSGFTASAIAADGKLYLTSEDGEVHVIAAGPQFEVLSVNAMGEPCMASPAVAEGTLYWRSRGHMVAVEQPEG